MDWTNEECLLLIEMYKARSILWDPTNSQYKMAKRKIDYWCEISKEMKKSVNEVKRKMESLQASYRRERRLEVNTKRSGAGADEVFHSKWFAFKAMQFLNDKFSPRETKDTIDPDNSQLLEDSIINVNENIIDELLGETSREAEQPREQRKPFVSPKKLPNKRKKTTDSDKVIQNLQNIMQDISDKRQAKKQKNDSTIFGEFIASKLEQFDDRTKTILQHQISSLIFNAELSFKFQHQTNQSQDTSTSQIAASLPDFQSIYSIPPQSIRTYDTSTSSPSMQLPYSTLTPSTAHHSTFSTQPQSPDTYFSSSSSPSLHSMSSVPPQSPQSQYIPNNFSDFSSIIAVHTSGIIDEMDDFDTLKSNDKLAKESPVAKYLRVKASLSFADIDNLNCESFYSSS
ncbi:uncharacterized protein LOC112597166 [Melanaphis sacchari]|uniref:uncharacterized protein LOC112597166 n=1 Tax=Melanaphis sacchari TaxID=742174 RepID=UPI000DC1305A|nr:uncharacterized protein LOC112597166 [Melanaphis sacchari]